MDPAKILIQLDSDLQPSSFDAIAGLDSCVDQVLSYREVDELNVVGIVHGAMFTRGPKTLRNTAIFIGGSDVALGERLLRKVVETFFGPIRVSVMLDSNGSNTTAAAAVASVLQHRTIDAETSVLVLGSTGPVGRRIAELSARQGASVVMASRDVSRARKAIDHFQPGLGRVVPSEIISHEELEAALQNTDVLFSAGAAGIEMVPQAIIERCRRPAFVVDVNAVPPLGIGGISPSDRGTSRDGKIWYGALGVGSLKMKIHRRAVQSLFESNDKVLDRTEIFELAKELAQVAAANV